MRNPAGGLEFRLLLFSLFFILFCWPILSGTNIQVTYLFMFLVWAAIIIALFFISRTDRVDTT